MFLCYHFIYNVRGELLRCLIHVFRIMLSKMSVVVKFKSKFLQVNFKRQLTPTSKTGILFIQIFCSCTAELFIHLECFGVSCFEGPFVLRAPRRKS